MNNKLASIEIKNKSFYIGAVLSFIDSLAAKHTAIDFGRYNRLRYIVGEMLKNRIEKAYPDTVGTINVDLFLTPLYFEVSIRDKGVPAWSDFTYNEDNKCSFRAYSFWLIRGRSYRKGISYVRSV